MQLSVKTRIKKKKKSRGKQPHIDCHIELDWQTFCSALSSHADVSVELLGEIYKNLPPMRNYRKPCY